MTESTRPFIRIHNTETDEVIDREMNDEEYAAHLEYQQAQKLAVESESKKSSEKQALLERLGITEDEAKLLLG